MRYLEFSLIEARSNPTHPAQAKLYLEQYLSIQNQIGMKLRQGYPHTQQMIIGPAQAIMSVLVGNLGGED